MLLRSAFRIFDDWSVRSQLRARRNAMVAATALAQRTAEAREVDAYLACRHRHPSLTAEQAPITLRA
ncbi:hypothetical protein BJ980_001174 [Nocardioides daedukensis]|uniref:Uncharacterized protein n=1 Tax=Nocardioides daedukensis TaxID=634462 RepID=A0A7Y9RX22_9ACTN|nr:hypothetical protein [Nocardioides daedukensis]NYG58251.1 hypothetical protein [Nocardioides daedukensis]